MRCSARVTFTVDAFVVQRCVVPSHHMHVKETPPRAVVWNCPSFPIPSPPRMYTIPPHPSSFKITTNLSCPRKFRSSEDTAAVLRSTLPFLIPGILSITVSMQTTNSHPTQYTSRSQNQTLIYLERIHHLATQSEIIFQRSVLLLPPRTSKQQCCHWRRRHTQMLVSL